MNKKQKKKSVFSVGKKVFYDINDPLHPWDRKIVNSLKRKMYDIAAYTKPDKWEETFIHQLEILVNVGSIVAYSLDLNIDGKMGDGKIALQMNKDTYTILTFTITPIED